MATFQVTGVAPGTANVIADPNATAVTASVTVTPPPDAAILPDAAPDAAPDGAEPDAAEPRDSGMRDAPARDSGGSGGTGGTGGTSGGTSSDSGCGCVVGGRSPTSSAWLLVLVALPLLRRRGARMK